MGRYKIRELSLRAILKFLIPVLLIIVVISWASYHFVHPIPPNTLVMTTGREQGSFVLVGERYRQVLARNSIHLKLLPSSGGLENFNRLLDESQKVDVGFVQGVTGRTEGTSNLVSLGSVFYIPLWVFYRSDETLDDLSQLRGKRINIGPEGSGIRKFALELQKAANFPTPPTELLEFSHNLSKKAIMEGRVDAIMVFGTVDSPIIQDMLYSKDIKLMNFSQAEAYTRLFPGLSHVVLPKGILNLSRNYPPYDIHLLAPTTNLIIRKSLHPALVYLLLKASVEIHSGAGWLHKAGEFPSLKTQDFPISEQAQRFFKSGGSILYDSLPFWVATFIDRMLLILIPLGVVLIPLIGIMPWLFTYRNRSKYYRWYRELRNFEKDLTEHYRPEKFNEYQELLDQIEKAVDRLKVSVTFYDEVFFLKEHIQLVRQKLIGLNRNLSEGSDHSNHEHPLAAEKID